MSDWLVQARAANATLGDVLPSTRGDALRAGISVRLGRRKLARRALIGSAGLTLAIGVAMLAFAPKNESRDTAAHSIAVIAAPSAAPDAPLAPPLDTQTLADGSRAIALDVTTELVVDRDDASETHVTLSTGAARFEVEPRAGKPFVVHAGELSVHVVGTRFVVTRLSELSVAVSVEHGEVEVVTPTAKVRLRAGEQRVFDRAIASNARLAGERPGPIAKRDTAGELLTTADLARREGRTDAAVTALQALVERHAKDPRAASAAFSLGRVLLEAQHKPKDAAAAFALVAKLEPASPLVEDALAREIEAWARAGALDRARSLAQAYLQRYPGGARAALVRSHAKLD